MTFSFNISKHTRIGDYGNLIFFDHITYIILWPFLVNMIESVVKGQVPLIYRSGRGQSNSSNEFVHELTLDSFYEDVLREEEKVNVFSKFFAISRSLFLLLPLSPSPSFSLSLPPFLSLSLSLSFSLSLSPGSFNISLCLMVCHVYLCLASTLFTG